MFKENSCHHANLLKDDITENFWEITKYRDLKMLAKNICHKYFTLNIPSNLGWQRHWPQSFLDVFMILKVIPSCGGTSYVTAMKRKNIISYYNLEPCLQTKWDINQSGQKNGQFTSE